MILQKTHSKSLSITAIGDSFSKNQNNRAAETYFNEARTSIVSAHNSLITTGKYEGSSIIDLFDKGAYVDATELAALNGAIDSEKRAISIEELGKVYYKQLLAGLINRAWRENGAYLVSFPMSWEECKYLLE